MAVLMTDDRIDRADVLARWAYEEYDSHFSMPGGLSWEDYKLDDPQGAEAVYLAPARMQVAALDGALAAREPTKQREGDQRLPDGDEDLVDDQQLLIDDIQVRRQVGIDRYGQGHRPFNGRDTLEDLYEEQLDFLVYLRSIKRMHESSRDELVATVAAELAALWPSEAGGSDIVHSAFAEKIIDRLQGWVAGMLINGGEK